jgi:hypothetical protein
VINNASIEVRNEESLGVIAAVVAVLFAVAVIAQAQQSKKVPRIGYLSIGDSATESTRSEGYIEGQNIATEYQYAERPS